MTPAVQDGSAGNIASWQGCQLLDRGLEPSQQILDSCIRSYPHFFLHRSASRVEHDHRVLLTDGSYRPRPTEARGVCLHATPLRLLESQRKTKALHLDPKMHDATSR